MTKARNKTTATDTSISSYLSSLDEETRAQATQLIDIFKKVTNTKPVLWGAHIVGFGSYHYTYESGREGDSLATGFAMRKAGPTIYIMPGYNNYENMLLSLGPHKLGKSCLYIQSVETIHVPTLKKLIRTGLADLKKIYPVTM